MGISIYYSATREPPLSEEEIIAIATRVLEYRTQNAMRGIPGEDFGVYSPNSKEPKLVFEGTTKLPDAQDTETTYTVITGVLECLTGVRRLLQGAQWEASLEDVPLIWEEENGWRLMSDEEFACRKPATH